MNNNKYKYLKYKLKYIKLKSKIKGGSSNLEHFDGRLIFNKDTNKTTYYQDIKKKWKFFTDKEGYELLLNCYNLIKKLLKKNIKLIKKSNQNVKNTINKGYYIYTKKKSLKKSSKSYGAGEYVTWSTEEYNHLGLQRYYLIVKSFQRFTETWSLLVRSYNNGVFDDIPDILNIATIGGGPGFECYSFYLFFKKYFPEKKCYFHILDLESNWGEYIKLFGDNFYFKKWDLYNDDLFDKIKIDKIDFVIISNFLVMYMTNKHSYDLMLKLLSNNTKAILINSRSKNIEAKKHLLKLGIFTTNLISNNDDRNIIFSLKKYNKTKNIKDMFPNTPFIK